MFIMLLSFKKSNDVLNLKHLTIVRQFCSTCNICVIIIYLFELPIVIRDKIQVLEFELNQGKPQI